MIYLMRHGLDDENYIGGWSDVGLTKEGIKQAHEIGLFLRQEKQSITRIYTSDIKRAVITAKIISSYLNLEVIETKLLRELDKGLLTGLKKKHAKDIFPEYFEDVPINTKYPQGESLYDLYQRVKELLEKDILKYDNTLLITHRGIINMVYMILSEDVLVVDKTKYNVTHASLHEFNINKRFIKKIK